MNDSKNPVNATEVQVESPPPPYFDELASANAKPVQPIPTRGVGFWIRRGIKGASNAREMVTGRTKALALVLVAGVAMGTLGGTILVHTSNSSPDAAPVVHEPAAAATSAATAATSSNGGQDTSLNDEIDAAQVSAMALQNAVKSSSRNRRRRAARPVPRVQRAYRVAVIR